AMLRESAGKSLAGMALPPLSEPELGWLRAPEGSADAALADVALARVRAEMAASVLEAVGADLVGLAGLPLAQYREDLATARAAVEAVTKLFRRDEARVKSLTALVGRIDDATKQLARIADQ